MLNYSFVPLDYESMNQFLKITDKNNNNKYSIMILLKGKFQYNTSNNNKMSTEKKTSLLSI